MTEITRRAVVLAALTGGITIMRSADLSTLFSPPEVEMGYRLGTVHAWNAQAGTNRVSVAGTVLDNLPILGGLEATTIRPGDTVGIIRVRSQYFILGRIARPDVASNVTVQVESGLFVPLVQLAGGLQSASVAAAESTTSDTFTDLTTAGPSLAGVEVYTDRALVTVSARIQPDENNTAYMGFEVSGTTSVAPDVLAAVGAGGINDSITVAASRTVLVEGLSPGRHTFTAKYASVNLATAFFSNRVITVQPY